MIYKVMLVKLMSIVLGIFTIFEILGHIEELFYIDQSVPYFEYLQNDLVRFFYLAILSMLVIFLFVLVKVILTPSDSKFLKLTIFTALVTSLLLILFVYLKITLTETIESEAYYPDKTIKGMAHFLGLIPSIIFLIYALFLFLISKINKSIH